MPVRPAIRPAYPREARHRHGASVRAPCLRSTVSIRCLRQLRCRRRIQVPHCCWKFRTAADMSASACFSMLLPKILSPHSLA